jgi:hypothetical protein
VRKTSTPGNKPKNSAKAAEKSVSATDFRSLAHKFAGKRICVMGGAPSLADDLKLVKADIYISANGHGADMVDPDFVLAMDEIHRENGLPQGEYLRTLTKAPIISPFGYAEFRLGDWPQHPRSVLSGMVAVWAAWMMGASVVIVAGCDGYGGQNGFLDEALKIARDVHCPVRVVSGPLIDAAWPAYDPAENFGEYKASTAIDGWLGKDGQINVEVLKPCTIARVDYPRGKVVEGVYRHDVAILLKHRMVKEV